MGEAKRRKQIDPNYSKICQKRFLTESWYQQMLTNFPKGFKIDQGYSLYGRGIIVAK